MKIIGVLLLLTVTACNSFDQLKDDWEAYKVKHGKSYKTPQEDQLRMGLFINTTLRVLQNQLHYYSGSADHKLKINEFADMTREEFSKYKLGFIQKQQERLAPTKRFSYNASIETPDSIDWRTLGAVTPVKDQGQCGSCWSFSATGALEGQNFIKTKKLVSLSEQQLMDCGGKFEPHLSGCEGGVMEEAFDYIRRNKGITSEAIYRYKAVQGPCSFSPSTVVATCTGYAAVDPNEDAMKQAVAIVGPISVSLSVNQHSGSYSQGIFPKTMCDVANNHGVLIVGYGTSRKGTKYWIVKNSWSRGWGMGGYFQLPRGINACGINRNPSFPLV